MTKFKVPTRGEVSEHNRQIFDKLEKQIGMVPNLYATMALSQNALGDFLSFSSRKSSLNKKEQEIINLSVSEVNGCTYCQAAHTAIGKMNGFSDDEIIEFRKGFSLNIKYHALAQISRLIVQKKGHISEESIRQFYEAGYSVENLIDLIFIVGEKTISNYLHGVFHFPVDFPLAVELQEQY